MSIAQPMPIQLKFKYLPKQKEFIRSTKRYCLYSGGVGSGKTYSGCFKSILMAWENPNLVGLIGAQTYRQLEDTTKYTFMKIIDDIEERIGYSIIKEHNKTKNYVIFLNDSKILFRSFDKAGKLKSLNLNFVYIDEATEVKEAIWKMLTTRLRREPIQQIFITTNPDTYFHWVYKQVIIPYLNGDDRFAVMQAMTSENVLLGEQYIDDMNKFEGTDEDYYKRYVMGQWGVSANGLVYKTFDPLIHIQEFNHKNLKYFFRSVDYGFNNPFACLFIGLDGDDNIYVFDEYYKREVLSNTNIENILSMHKELTYKMTYIDPSAVETKQQFRSKGVNILSAKNDVKGGIQAVQKMLAIKENGKPSLYIHPRCKNLLEEIQVYRWTESEEVKSVQKEEPVKQNDHALDALRYFVYSYFGLKNRIGKSSSNIIGAR